MSKKALLIKCLRERSCLFDLTVIGWEISKQYFHWRVSVILFRGGLCMMSLPVWLPGPMFLLGEVSVPGTMFLLRAVSVLGVSVKGTDHPPPAYLFDIKYKLSLLV